MSVMVDWVPDHEDYRLEVGHSGEWTNLPVTTTLSDWKQERKFRIAEVPQQHGGINIADGKWKASRLSVNIEIAEASQQDLRAWMMYWYEVFMYVAYQSVSVLAVRNDANTQTHQWEWNEVTGIGWRWHPRTKHRAAVLKIDLLSLKEPWFIGFSNVHPWALPDPPA